MVSVWHDSFRRPFVCMKRTSEPWSELARLVTPLLNSFGRACEWSLRGTTRVGAHPLRGSSSQRTRNSGMSLSCSETLKG